MVDTADRVKVLCFQWNNLNHAQQCNLLQCVCRSVDVQRVSASYLYIMHRSPQPPEHIPSIADAVVSDVPHRTLVHKSIAHLVYQYNANSQTCWCFPREDIQINQNEAYIVRQDDAGRESSS